MALAQGMDRVRLLSREEIELVRSALTAALDPMFFPDWEFQTLFGVERSTVGQVRDSWPNRSVTEDEFACAVVNSLSNLLAYPHGHDDLLGRYVPEGRTRLHHILKKLTVPRP
jgi:hypothetical protein